MLEIDGSFGEGGGQIIRSAISLSALTGVPFRIYNVRKGRPRRGLRAQHLLAVRAVQQISGAAVEGDYIGSEEFRFRPTTLKAGSYRFDIGTAGATPLVLQALLPPLLFASAPSHLLLSGGTHVPISPPFHFISEVFLPVIREVGVHVHSSVITYGFYPRGGGEIEAEVRPVAESGLRAVTFPEKKVLRAVSGTSAVANLPLSIAERQKNAALQVMSATGLPVDFQVVSVPSPGHGTFLFLETGDVPCRAGFSAIGVRGKRAEIVGSEAAQAFLEYHGKEGCVDSHLADQIVIYLALAHGESTFTTTAVTAHLMTNLWVIKQFLPIDYAVEGDGGGPGKVRIRGAGYGKAKPGG